MEFFVEVIKENDFVPLANKASENMLTFAAYLGRNGAERLSKRFYVAFIKESIELEDFLDDHGARNNKTWVFYGEIVASIRNFSSNAYMISHILSRIKFYKIKNKKLTSFIKEANKRRAFLNDTILSLFSNLKEEALRLGLDVPDAGINEREYQENILVKALPNNIDDEGAGDINENAVRVAAEFIDAYNESDTVVIRKKVPYGTIENSIIPGRINEETLRHLETHVHNAQSMYDTYIQKTPFESQKEMLPRLRGHISVTLHLLGISKELCHFFERHETSVRTAITQKKIARIVNRKKVLDTILNFALYYYTVFLMDGHKIAQDILSEFSVAVCTTVSVPEGLGFHLRPSTLVAKVVNHHSGQVHMIIGDKEFDASSVIDIMWAGGMVKKECITEIAFRGDKNAVRDLKLLAEANYGEDTMGNSTPLPEELSYLRQG